MGWLHRFFCLCMNVFNAEQKLKINTVMTLITINLMLWFLQHMACTSVCISHTVYFFSDILVTNIKMDMTYVDFCTEIKDICKFDDCQPFTVKWLDEEGEGLCGVVYKYGLQGKLRVFCCVVCWARGRWGGGGGGGRGR